MNGMPEGKRSNLPFGLFISYYLTNKVLVRIVIPCSVKLVSLFMVLFYREVSF